MISVTRTMAKKKPIDAEVGWPSEVWATSAAAGAAWPGRSWARDASWSMEGSPWIWKFRGEGLALQLALEALDLGVVRLVRPADVERGERPREHDHGHADRDRERRHLADPLRDEVLRRRDEEDVPVVADEEEDEQDHAHLPPQRNEGLERLRLHYLVGRLGLALARLHRP